MGGVAGVAGGGGVYTLAICVYVAGETAPVLQLEHVLPSSTYVPHLGHGRWFTLVVSKVSPSL